MTILFIVFMDFVIKCVGPICQPVSAEYFNTLLKAGVLEIAFDAAITLKIFWQKTREEKDE